MEDGRGSAVAEAASPACGMGKAGDGPKPSLLLGPPFVDLWSFWCELKCLVEGVRHLFERAKTHRMGLYTCCLPSSLSLWCLVWSEL